MADLCLTLLCPPAQHERLLDALLLMPEVSLFTSSAVAAHGLGHAHLTASEQVLGLALMTQVQVLLADAQHAAVLAALREGFAGSAVRYWLTPIIQVGEFE
jgi:hypothetical protein